ncbi:hypothetical protein [Moorena producens]|uniref:hypothetical protein n=1 Tax=Moorena producens TaxID=1155739 RepID=UPI003C70BCC9
MANIEINDIKVTGIDLFVDAESFLNDLKDQDVSSVIGGINDVVTTAYTCCAGSCTCPAREFANHAM